MQSPHRFPAHPQALQPLTDPWAYYLVHLICSLVSCPSLGFKAPTDPWTYYLVHVVFSLVSCPSLGYKATYRSLDLPCRRCSILIGVLPVPRLYSHLPILGLTTVFSTCGLPIRATPQCPSLQAYTAIHYHPLDFLLQLIFSQIIFSQLPAIANNSTFRFKLLQLLHIQELNYNSCTFFLITITLKQKNNFINKILNTLLKKFQFSVYLFLCISVCLLIFIFSYRTAVPLFPSGDIFDILGTIFLFTRQQRHKSYPDLKYKILGIVSKHGTKADILFDALLANTACNELYIQVPSSTRQIPINKHYTMEPKQNCILHSQVR